MILGSIIKNMFKRNNYNQSSIMENRGKDVFAAPFLPTLKIIKPGGLILVQKFTTSVENMQI